MSAVYLVVFAGVLVLLFGLTAQRSSSILAPAPLWNAAWAVLFLATGALGADFTYDTTAVMVLFFAVVAFNVGAILVDGVPGGTTQRAEDPPPRRIPSGLLLICLGAGVLGAAQLSRSFGTSLLDLRSLADLFAAGQQNAVLIFQGEAELSQGQKVTFAVLQTGAALAGAKLRLDRSRAAIVWVGAFLVTALLWSAITTQRSYLLVPVVWAVAGYVAAAVRQGTYVLPPRTLLRAGASVVLLALAVVYVRAVRVSGGAASLTADTFTSARLWVAGYVPTFSAWYADGGASGEISPGLLGGLYALLGTGTEGGDDTGGYEYIGAGLTSNAATMMRTVFGTAGTFAAFVIVVGYGLVAQALYRRAIAGGIVGAAAYAGVVASILWATNAWFFNYGGRLLALGAILALAFIASFLPPDPGRGGLTAGRYVSRPSGQRHRPAGVPQHRPQPAAVGARIGSHRRRGRSGGAR